MKNIIRLALCYLTLQYLNNRVYIKQQYCSASGQTILNNVTGIQTEENLNDYDSEFFSIKYPTSWFVSAGRGISDSPGASGVTLVNQIDMNDVNYNNNRVTPRSHVEHSVIVISVFPKTAFGKDTSNFDISEILDSFINYSFSSQKFLTHS